MTCQELREMIDRDGAPTTGDANAHLHDCPSCSEFFATWQEVRRGLHALGEEEPPPFLHTRLMAHVREAVEVDSQKKEAWFFGLKKIWAGPLLVLFLGMLLGGYGLMQVLRPRPASAPPPAPLGTLQREPSEFAKKAERRSEAIPHGGNAPKEKMKQESERLSPVTEEAVPKSAFAAPAPPPSPGVAPGRAFEEDKKRERGDSIFENAPEGEQASSGAYQPLSNSSGAIQGQEDAVQRRATAQKDAISDRPQAPSASDSLGGASENLARSEEEPSEVVCTLSPLSGFGPFITLQLPAGAAPPSGGIWTVHVLQDGVLRVQDALGKPVAAPLATLTGVIRPLRVPLGSYKLKRIS